MLIKWKKCSNCDTYHDPTLEKCPKCHKHNELYLNREISNHVAFFHPIAQIGIFLAGFSYVGMLLAELFSGSIFQLFVQDELLWKTLTISLTYLLMFVGLAMIVISTRRDYFFKKYTRGIDYLYGLGYAVTLVLASSILGALILIFHTPTDNVNQTTAIDIAKGYPILAFVIMGILGPICEELTYRVGLYSFLRRINKWLALAVTALVFAFIHFSFDGDIIEELWSFPSYLLSGVILTLAYEHRGPACSMTAHLAYNIFAFTLMLVSK